MNLSERDRRALLILIPVILLVFVIWLVTNPSTPSPAGEINSVETAEKRLRKLRVIAAGVPAKQRAYAVAAADLAVREKTLISADDEKLAQEKLADIVRKLAASQVPPIEMRSVEFGQPKAAGDFGEVAVTLSFPCKIEQLVNFLSDVTAQPEALASEEMHIFGAQGENKTMQVRLTLAGLIPARLIPKKKELTEF